MRPSPFREPDADRSTGLLFWQVSAAWQRQVNQALAPLGLTQVRFVALAGIGWFNGRGVLPSQAELARHARTDAMMLSTVLRQLAQAGWVARLSHPTDARVWQLQLTAAGAALLAQAAPVVEQVDATFFAALGERQPELNALLHRLGAGGEKGEKGEKE